MSNELDIQISYTDRIAALADSMGSLAAEVLAERKALADASWLKRTAVRYREWIFSSYDETERGRYVEMTTEKLEEIVYNTRKTSAMMVSKSDQLKAEAANS